MNFQGHIHSRVDQSGCNHLAATKATKGRHMGGRSTTASDRWGERWETKPSGSMMLDIDAVLLICVNENAWRRLSRSPSPLRGTAARVQPKDHTSLYRLARIIVCQLWKKRYIVHVAKKTAETKHDCDRCIPADTSITVNPRLTTSHLRLPQTHSLVAGAAMPAPR